MSKTFIFAFNAYYPSGGIDGLVAVLDHEVQPHVGPDFLILPEELAKVVAACSKDHYQVLHFAADGAPLLVEHWERLMAPVLGAMPETMHALPGGDVLVRRSIVTEGFPGES